MCGRGTARIRRLIPAAQSIDTFLEWLRQGVIPAKAGTQRWAPAFAGVTNECGGDE